MINRLRKEITKTVKSNINCLTVEGNPSSTTLKLLLKEEGARKFMEEIIMPI